MNELMKAAARISLAGLLLSAAVWIAVEGWRPVAAGFAAGTLISLANAHLLRIRVMRLTGEAGAKGGKRAGPGFGVRTALVLAGALAAVRFPHVLNLPAVMAGSFIVQFTMLPVALWHALRGRG